MNRTREWRQRLKSELNSPYTTRNLTLADPEESLVGREELLDDLYRVIRSRSLVVLHGDSGAGKSSLIQSGLFRRLIREQYLVLLANEWSTDSDDDIAGSADERSQHSVDIDLARRIARAHDPGKGSGLTPINASAAAALEQAVAQEGMAGYLTYPVTMNGEEVQRSERTVIVLDQFEELLRDDLSRAAEVVDWVRAMGHRSSAVIIISLRSDSTYLLDPLFKGMRPYSLERLVVPPVTDIEHVREIIERPVDGGEASIDPTVVEDLINAWRTARLPSLLGLHASLQTLFLEARASGKTAPSGRGLDVPRIDATRAAEEAGVWTKFLEKAGVGRISTAGEAQRVFESGLEQSVALKIAAAEKVSDEQQLDPYLIEGTRELVRRAAPLLSSGGFKTQVAADQLVVQILNKEVETLRHAVSGGWDTLDINRAIREKWLPVLDGDPIGSSAESGIATQGVSSSELSVQRVHTAGPLLGRSAEQVLFEEVRRAAFAIEWLVATELVREASGRLALVHDGSGEPLREWAEEHPPTIERAIRGITASSGEQFNWVPEDGGWTLDGDGTESGALRLITNANWRDSRITMNLRNVVFVNCDFSGVRFVNCTFQGVTLVNCQLDDANFENCTFRGRTGMLRHQRSDEDGKKGETRLSPSFWLPGLPDVEKRSFEAYGCGSGPDLLSDMVGRPALPQDSRDGHPDPAAEIIEFQAAGGGLALLGGRVCFLTFYRCTDDADGEGYSVSIHHVAGGGLDLVEPAGGSLEMFDVAVRGISVSRDTRTSDAPTCAIALGISGSFITNVYFSGGLEGTARVEDTTVWMLMNASPSPDLSVELVNSRFHALVNAEVGDPSATPTSSIDDWDIPPSSDVPTYFEPAGRAQAPSLFVPAGGDPVRIAQQLARMDYRYRPEEFEEGLRRQSSGASD